MIRNEDAYRHRDSATGELIIASVPVTSGATIGIVHCPGRNQTNGSGKEWTRDLADDLAALETWGTQALLSLVEEHEFARLGVPNFKSAIEHHPFQWYHLPIPDMSAPGPAYFEAWSRHRAEILRQLEAGEKIVVHCAGGLGRSGMIAAKFLTDFGVSPEIAISRVRQARPGAIETPVQENYVANGPPLRTG